VLPAQLLTDTEIGNSISDFVVLYWWSMCIVLRTLPTWTRRVQSESYMYCKTQKCVERLQDNRRLFHFKKCSLCFSRIVRLYSKIVITCEWEYIMVHLNLPLTKLPRLLPLHASQGNTQGISIQILPHSGFTFPKFVHVGTFAWRVSRFPRFSGYPSGMLYQMRGRINCAMTTIYLLA
jgi:hypothetical protein